MTRARTAVVLSALLLALAGCSSGSDPKPAAAPSSAATSAAPATSAAVDDRAACRKNVDTANALDLAPDSNVANGNHAAESDNPGIARAGVELVEVATAARTAEDVPAANLDIRQAQRDLAEACANLLGDGPW